MRRPERSNLEPLIRSAVVILRWIDGAPPNKNPAAACGAGRMSPYPISPLRNLPTDRKNKMRHE